MAHALLVEDDVFSSVILQEILLAGGNSVRMAYDGPTALRLIASEQVYHIAVVDLLLPGLVGFDVIRALRRRSATMGVIAIGGTGPDGSSPSQRAASDAGADVMLTKPISRTDLSRQVATLLKRAQTA